jgi:hypothetical protein
LLAADRLHPEQVRPVGSASECRVHLESVMRGLERNPAWRKS